MTGSLNKIRLVVPGKFIGESEPSLAASCATPTFHVLPPQSKLYQSHTIIFPPA